MLRRVSSEKTVKSYCIYIPLFIFGVSFIFSPNSGVFEIIAFLISGVFFIIGMRNAMIARPCGHGVISQFGPFYCPFVVKKCSKCGEIYE